MSRRIGLIIFCIAGVISLSLFAYNIYFSMHLPSAVSNGLNNNACGNNCSGAISTPSPTAKPTLPATTPTSTGQPTALPGYKLIWNDEFNGTQLDSRKWYAVNNLGGNAQQGCCLSYSYSSLITPSQLRVHDGMLTITTARNATNGKAYKTGAITTETLSDKPTFTFTYGRIDIRAKLPHGKGVWPAMWLLTSPASSEVSYEIDMMEMLGEDPHTIYMVDHHNGDRQYCDYKGPDYSQGFHDFAFDWKPNKITWFVDGQTLCSTTRSIPNQPMYVIINTALSDGEWGQPVNGATPLPQTFDIDYVRVYKPI